MKKPLRRGTAIDNPRMTRWVSLFSNYRDTVLQLQIDNWLRQFKGRDRDLAARILDSVEFITDRQVRSSFHSLLDSLPRWNRSNTARRGKWRFVAFSKSAGESGDTMIHIFRQANNLNEDKYNDLFIYKRDLLQEKLGPKDTVVFVDDFAGSGKQACETWLEEFPELLPGNPHKYLILVATNIYARKKIEEQTGLEVVTHRELTEHDNIFSSKCKHFSLAERRVLLEYCKIADAKRPKGFGDCGFLITFSHNCPNNSISILHARNPRWYGLFGIYD
jgi:hypothetical protein